MGEHNNGSALLLTWVNHERLHLGHTLPLYDFHQLAHSDFLFRLLQDLHPTHFLPLNHLEADPPAYLQALEVFLLECEGRKMSRSYRREVEARPVQEMLKVVLSLLLQGPRKAEFISRIVEMQVAVQSYLMQELQRVGACLENCIEIKDVLCTLERLEEENQLLREHLKLTSQRNEQLVEHLSETKAEQRRAQKQVQQYENQKKHVLQELQVVDLRDYVELFRLLRNENQELAQALQDMEEGRREAHSEANSMRQRISEDSVTISHLHQQLQALRNNYLAAKEEAVNLSLSFEAPEEPTALRENKNFGNVKMRNSLETTASDKASVILSRTFDQEDHENDRLRAYNQEIMFKLQTAYQTIGNLNTEAAVLREEQGRLQRKNAFLEKKLTDLKKEQSRFLKELRTMGF